MGRLFAKPLTEDEEQFVLGNYQKMTVPEMARELHIRKTGIYRFMQERRLVTLKGRKPQPPALVGDDGEEYFNVNALSCWLVGTKERDLNRFHHG